MLLFDAVGAFRTCPAGPRLTASGRVLSWSASVCSAASNDVLGRLWRRNRSVPKKQSVVIKETRYESPSGGAARLS